MDLKQTAVHIFQEAVNAADPYLCVQNAISLHDNGDIEINSSTYSSSEYPRVIIIGGGKASARMGQAAEQILGSRITDGWINTKDDHAIRLEHCTVHECSHPVPDERGVVGTHHIIDLLESADEHTLVICLLSGGGSALMPAPVNGISLAEKQDVTRLLLSAGADIVEINAIRKHLSTLKGGGMAHLADPAALHVLILSDVIGDPLDTIASGPAVADPSTFADCIDICKRHAIYDSLPQSVQHHFEDGAKGNIPETAKEGDVFLRSVKNTIIGNNRMSVDAAEQSAQNLGFNTLVLSTSLHGEASQLGTFFAAIASEIHQSDRPISRPACIIGGGETTVTIHGTGKGGRNQEMALSAAIELSDARSVSFLSGGTDGTDGPTDAAGAVVDGLTVSKCLSEGCDPLVYIADNDSYTCLSRADALVQTGPTGTNVMDIQLLLVGDIE